MALPATDTFTAANGTQLTTYSASWTLNNQDFDIQSNGVSPDGSTDHAQHSAHWNADAFNANQYSQIVLVGPYAPTNYLGVAARVHASAATYYLFYGCSGDSLVGKVIADEVTWLGSAGAAFNVGQTVRIEANGTTITPKINGSELNPPGAQTDSAIASGSAGIAMYYYNSGARTTHQVDDWEGGNLAGGPVSTPMSFAGGGTPSGVLTKQDQKSLAGGMTPSGTIAKSDGKAYAGGLIPSGTIVKRDNKTFAGGGTPTGTLARVVNLVRSYAGGMTPSGTLSRVFTLVRSYAGGMTPTGVLGRIVNLVRSYAGGLTPSGTIVKQNQKTFAGGGTPSGVLVRVVNLVRSFAGDITPSGVLTKVKGWAMSFAGGITPTGEFSRVAAITRTLIGSITPTGIVTKQIGKMFTGGSTPTGVLTKVKAVIKTFTGAITPNGTLIKQDIKILIGGVIPAGVVAKQVIKTFIGSIASAGNAILTHLVAGAFASDGMFIGIEKGTKRKMNP